MCSGISAGQSYIFERISAVHFFAEYANDFPRFRHYMSGSTGIPFLVQAIKSVEYRFFGLRDTVWYVCETLADLSKMDWCIPTFACLDVCPTFVKLLMYVIGKVLHSSSNVFVCSV
jgi:hypothetical protein